MSNIRKANADDALVITEISVDTWKKTYEGLLPPELLTNRNVDEKRINSWKENIANSDYTVLVYEDKKVCGYLWGGKKKDKIDVPYEIYAIYVSPEYQRSGIGQALMAEYKKMINNKPFYLYMLKGNGSASAWAEKKTCITTENSLLANIVLKKKFIFLSNSNMIKDVVILADKLIKLSLYLSSERS